MQWAAQVVVVEYESVAVSVAPTYGQPVALVTVAVAAMVQAQLPLRVIKPGPVHEG